MEDELHRIASAVENIRFDTSSINADIDFGSIEPIIGAAILIVGCVLGWRKSIAMLLMYTIWDLISHNGASPHCQHMPHLLLVILVWWTLGAILKAVNFKLKKKSAADFSS